MKLLAMLKAAFSSAPRRAPADCAQLIRSGEALLVDVRESGEWAEGVADKAALLAMSDLTGPRAAWGPFLAKVKDREIFLYCASGTRSGLAARLLAAEGIRATNTGGLGDWLAAGWPVSKPRSR